MAITNEDGTAYDVADDNELAEQYTGEQATELELPNPSIPLEVAKAVVRHYSKTPDKIITIRRWNGHWITWNGKNWEIQRDERIKASMYKYTDDKYYLAGENAVPKKWNPNKAKISNLMDALESLTQLPEVDDNKRPQRWISDERKSSNYVACKNALVNVDTLETQPHTPDFLTFNSVPYNYDPKAEVPNLWLEFLNSLWSETPEYIDILQEYVGYLLSGRKDLEKMLYLFGPRRSGKSVIQRVITALMGEKNSVGVSLDTLSGSFGLSELIGKSFGTLGDVTWEKRYSKAAAVLLRISGNDVVQVNIKNKDAESYSLPTRFVLSSNDLPVTDHLNSDRVTMAFIGRLIILETKHSFYGREDPTLKGKLIMPKLLSGIFNWAMVGLERLNKNGHFTTSSAVEEVQTEAQESSSRIKTFINDNQYQIGDEFKIVKADLYEQYTTWCALVENDRNPMTNSVFFRELKSGYPEINTEARIREKVNTDVRINEKSKQVRYCFGIGPAVE